MVPLIKGPFWHRGPCPADMPGVIFLWLELNIASQHLHKIKDSSLYKDLQEKLKCVNVCEMRTCSI